MTPVPLDLPLRPSEAAELANLVFDQAERKPLTDDVRNRLAARASVLRLETIQPYFGSLERDPVHPSVYYLAIDGDKGEPLLLHMALATAPTSSIFYKPLLIGRVRRLNGPEMVINAIPFGASDQDHLDKFTASIDSAFLPRPQGSRTAIAVAGARPEADFPAAFDAFRGILKRTGKNLAALSVPATVSSARGHYSAGLWAAIRAGWREGYSHTLKIPACADSLDAAKETIRQAAGFSGFSVDIAPLAGWPQAAAAEAANAWILDEFGRAFEVGGMTYEFGADQVERLVRKFGAGLAAAAQLHEFIRETRAAAKPVRSFDFEISFEGAGEATAPEELLFCLHWLRTSGHATQLAAPALGDEPEWMEPLAAIARHYQCSWSVACPAEGVSAGFDRVVRAGQGRLHLQFSASAGDVRDGVERLAAQLLG